MKAEYTLGTHDGQPLLAASFWPTSMELGLLPRFDVGKTQGRNKGHCELTKALFGSWGSNAGLELVDPLAITHSLGRFNSLAEPIPLLLFDCSVSQG